MPRERPFEARLRRLWAPAPAGPEAVPGDGALLRRFAERRDESAFAALVGRHGPRVARLCRRWLGDGPDADDAFQATFLVLAGKPGSVRDPDTLASWLHGVALRVVRRARRQAAARARLARSAPPPSPPAGDELERRELHALLDEVIGKLPAKYRLPVLLCYFDGHTNEEAARRLGWPAGTVCGRLARARQLLRTRLVRRGVTPAAAATVLAEGAAEAAVPLASSAATLARTVSFPAGPVSAPAQALAREVVRMMMLRKALAITVALAGVLAVAGGAVGWALQAPPAGSPSASETPPAPPKSPKPAEEDSPEIKAILKERRDALRAEMTARMKQLEAGRATLATVFTNSRQLLEAELELTDKPAERLTAHNEHFERMKTCEKAIEALFKAGLLAVPDYQASRAARLEAEVGLLRAKKKLPTPAK